MTERKLFFANVNLEQKFIHDFRLLLYFLLCCLFIYFMTILSAFYHKLSTANRRITFEHFIIIYPFIILYVVNNTNFSLYIIYHRFFIRFSIPSNFAEKLILNDTPKSKKKISIKYLHNFFFFSSLSPVGALLDYKIFLVTFS